MPIILYSYFRSSAAYRVRIALNLKNIGYEIRPVHLLKNGGEQFKADYLALNPQGRVPVLVVENTVLSQSSAIIEYLEEVYPTPPLLPANAIERAYVRSLAQIIACDIHPLNNLRVLNYLNDLVQTDFQLSWYSHWIHEGFSAIEQLLLKNNSWGRFCHGDAPGMADAFLIPQVYNAFRFGCEMNNFPLISAIYENCMQEAAFSNAAPDNQPDAET
ncbi:putative maleylacetoacetate isomerase MaiA [Methyloglobulus morosus KoM1]|uniref:Putative maleylacetoacetate isomerase MaiA n=1 Tax=Methyloglobulus morosus KoM1 TaxID=1116472 RepID=V5CAH7_9GAMM|nr:maleylacetoacetate isomerase [Methyloglobulus morosus]ESS73818.1 putative maleylacetoacetate isomerase MaiA [Methyloglobulus morosus KoM1]